MIIWGCSGSGLHTQRTIGTRTPGKKRDGLGLTLPDHHVNPMEVGVGLLIHPTHPQPHPPAILCLCGPYHSPARQVRPMGPDTVLVTLWVVSCFPLSVVRLLPA